jgi:isoleucyl-tRNA synthetase
MRLPEQWRDPQLAATWEKLRAVRQEVNKALEQARTDKLIGASTEAKLILKVADPHLYALLEERAAELRYLFITSQVELIKAETEAAELQVVVQRAEGKKCVRCWNYSPRVGNLPNIQSCVSAA